MENDALRMINEFRDKINIKSKTVEKISNSVRSSLSATVDINAIPWFHNSSI